MDFNFSKLSATPVAPPIVPRPVAAPTVPASSVVTSNTTGTSAAALSQPASSATSRLVAGMSPAGNIPSGASDQEKVCCSKIFPLTETIFNAYTSLFNTFFLRIVILNKMAYHHSRDSLVYLK